MIRRLLREATPGAIQKLLGWALDRPWVEYAACRETDADLFFPELGGSTRPAKRICSGCPVKEECLAEALEQGDRWGVRGGLSERERRKLAAQRRQEAA